MFSFDPFTPKSKIPTSPKGLYRPFTLQPKSLKPHLEDSFTLHFRGEFNRRTVAPPTRSYGLSPQSGVNVELELQTSRTNHFEPKYRIKKKKLVPPSELRPNAFKNEKKPEDLETWEENSLPWSDYVETDPHRIYFLGPAFDNFIGNNGEKKVADIGCGEGWYTRRLLSKNRELRGPEDSEKGWIARRTDAKPPKSILAIDVIPDLITIAQTKSNQMKAEEKKWRKEVRLNPGKVKYLQGSATDLKDIPDQSVDEVDCSMVIMDIDDVKQAFSEFRRILKPNGILNFISKHPFTVRNERSPITETENGHLLYENPKYYKKRKIRVNVSVSNMGNSEENEIQSIHFHKTLSTLYNTLLEVGLKPIDLREPVPPPAAYEHEPKIKRWTQAPFAWMVKAQRVETPVAPPMNHVVPEDFLFESIYKNTRPRMKENVSEIKYSKFPHIIRAKTAKDLYTELEQLDTIQEPGHELLLATRHPFWNIEDQVIQSRLRERNEDDFFDIGDDYDRTPTGKSSSVKVNKIIGMRIHSIEFWKSYFDTENLTLSDIFHVLDKLDYDLIKIEEPRPSIPYFKKNQSNKDIARGIFLPRTIVYYARKRSSYNAKLTL